MGVRCALETLENNGMINKMTVMETVTFSTESQEYIHVDIPSIIVTFENEDNDFQQTFRKLMKSKGYICPDYAKCSGSYYDKKDIKEVIEKIPEEESVLLNMSALTDFRNIEYYIQKEYSDNYSIYHRTNGISLINKKIREERLEREKNKRQNDIEFLKRVFK